MGILGFLAAIILAILFGYFAFLNQAPVQLNFFYPIPPQHALLHEVIGYSALAGALFSAFLALGPLWRSSRTVRMLRRQVRALEEQLKTLPGTSPSTPLFSDNSTALATARTTPAARADEEPV